MKKTLNKIFVVITIIMLVGMSFITDIVYATNAIETKKNKVEDNVIFDARINYSYQVISSISNDLALNIGIMLNDTGYLKNAKIKINNANYEISKSAEELNKDLMKDSEIRNIDKIINSADKTQLEIKDIESKEKLRIDVPIKFNKKETVKKEDLQRESEIELTATHVDENGKETTIRKTVKEFVKWTVNAESQITQNITRYIKYNNQTIISMQINDGIKDNAIPIKEKEIKITVPKINNKEPKKINVIGENITNSYNNGILTIKKKNDAQNGIKWDTSEEYNVTYVYDEITNSQIINTSAEETAVTISDEKINCKTKENTFEPNVEIGTIVDLKTDATKEVNKGYLYTNINRTNNKLNTEFKVNYKINVGYVDLTDKVVLKEENTILKDENNGNISSTAVKNDIISVDLKEYENILGKDGQIIVKNKAGEEIGKLNINNPKLKLNTDEITIETSEIKHEGNLNLVLTKHIEGNNDISTSDLKRLNKIVSIATVKGFKTNTEITSQTVEKEINFVEPTSKASINVSNSNLSTAVTNKAVSFDIVLNRTDISDMLYIDPTFKITLPEEITNIKLKSIKVVYDNELIIESGEAKGREIIVKLKGIQTQYNSLTTTKGTLIRVTADLDLNILATSNNKKVYLEYTNNYTNEIKNAETDIKIVAPSQFITTNKVEIGEKSALAIINNSEPIRIRKDNKIKNMKITGQIINNRGQNAEGVVILGRIPTKGTKTIGGADLGNNIETVLNSEIEIAGINKYKIYYSKNKDEKIDGAGWQLERTNDVKSYKIEIEEEIKDKSIIGFRYNVVIPAELDYEQVAKQNYGVYYNNNANKGNSKNLVESKVAGGETGKKPNIKVEISAYNTFTGKEIKEKEEITEGEVITYRTKITNTGTDDINNVKLHVNIPDKMNLVAEDDGNIDENIDSFVVKSWQRDIDQDFGTIKGYKSLTYEFNAQVSGIYYDIKPEDNLTDEEKEDINSSSVEFYIYADILDDPITKKFENKLKKGYLSLALTSKEIDTETPNKDISYIIKVENVNYDEKKNVNVSFDLPEGTKYKENINGAPIEYDEKNNQIKINYNKLEEREIKLIEFSITDELRQDREFKVFAKAYCDEMLEEAKSNYITNKIELAKNSLSAKQTLVSSKDIYDYDEIEFSTEITNTSKDKTTIEYNNSIDSNIEVLEYSIIIDGVTVRTNHTNYISEIIEIPGNKKATIVVKGIPFPIENDTKIKIENKPEIITENEDYIDINTIEINIKSSIYDSSSEEETNIDNKKYNILGNIWVDSNKNGIKESDEDKISNVNVKLYDVKQKQVMKDSDNNDIETYTDKDGYYEFNNLEKGKYIVIAFYNKEIYEIGDYRAQDISENINSDFVKATLDDEEVAATDIVEINDSNVFDIDLGLTEKSIFNLDIEDTIDKITIENESEQNKIINVNNNNAKLELSKNDLNNATITIEYTIKIKNIGNMDGYAKTIINNLPEGMTFNPELNKDWYLGKNQLLYTTSLANEKINPGETKELKLILSKKLNGDEIGITITKAEILNTYNENGVAEIKAMSGSLEIKENNLANANIVITKKNHTKVIILVLMSVLIIMIIAPLIYKEIEKRSTRI